MPIKEKTYLLFILLLAGVFSIEWNNNSPYMMAKWIVLSGGTLRVNGSTNINTFSCVVANDSKPDTLNCFLNKDASVAMTGTINLDVFGFDCHNPMMTADLRKTLKAKDYPMMKISFISLNKFPDLKSTQEQIKGSVNIELANVSRRYEVSYKFFLDEKKTIHLIGDRSVNFSDFKLTPPKKLGGIIRANDNLDVEFGLSLKATN
jgi:hypothetical protein